jgi:hypothetical protein
MIVSFETNFNVNLRRNRKGHGPPGPGPPYETTALADF